MQKLCQTFHASQQNKVKLKQMIGRFVIISSLHIIIQNMYDPLRYFVAPRLLISTQKTSGADPGYVKRGGRDPKGGGGAGG